MIRIEQLDKDGCGIAAVAMLTGNTYAEVRTVMFGIGRVHTTNTEDIRNALNYFGYDTPDRLIPLRKTPMVNLPHNAIVKVNPRGSTWHWCVWDATNKCLIDSAAPPHDGYNLISYLPATKRRGSWSPWESLASLRLWVAKMKSKVTSAPKEPLVLAS